VRAAWPVHLSFVCVAGAAACHRAAPSDVVEAGPPVASASTEEPPVLAPWPSSSAPLPPELPAGPPAPPGEAKRSTTAALERDPSLRPYLSTLRGHFAEGGVAGPFAVQWIERAGGGGAVLVSRADESEPVVLAVDRDRILFTRERPTAGITPPAQHVTITPGPERGVAIFSYVPAMHLVAARMWADDGNPFAEIVTLSTDACDGLSAAYGAGLGWIVACSSKNGTRAQRLKEDLTGAWGTEGAVVGTIGPVDRPTLTIDDANRWTLTQRARAVGGDRTLKFRYDRDAQPLQASN
jgi:hypothetical protein